VLPSFPLRAHLYTSPFLAILSSIECESEGEELKNKERENVLRDEKLNHCCRGLLPSADAEAAEAEQKVARDAFTTARTAVAATSETDAERPADDVR
jgi:predicted KAP-like P-loop ATPase